MALTPAGTKKAAVQAGAFAADHVIGMKIPERDGPEKTRRAEEWRQRSNPRAAYVYN
jgi:hypothetical protein